MSSVPFNGRRPARAGLGHQKIRLVWQGDVRTEVSALRSPSLSDAAEASASSMWPGRPTVAPRRRAVVYVRRGAALAKPRVCEIQVAARRRSI